MKLLLDNLRKYHLLALADRLQPQHAWLRDDLTAPNFYHTAISLGPAVAFIDQENIYGVVGMLDLEKFSVLWGTLAHDAIAHSVAIFRKTLHLLDHEWARPAVVAHIDPEFPEAKRLVKCLGFVYDKILPGFTLEGFDREQWVRGTIDAPAGI